MVDQLEVPHVFACGGIHGDDGIPIEIVAGTIASVIVAGSRTHRHEDKVALFVDAEVPAPDVQTGSLMLPRIVQPGSLKVLVTRLNHRFEAPQFSARAGVVNFGVAGGAVGALAIVVAHDDEVLVDVRRAAPGDFDVDHAFFAETRIGVARSRVEREHLRPDGVEDSRRIVCHRPASIRCRASRRCRRWSGASRFPCRCRHPAPPPDCRPGRTSLRSRRWVSTQPRRRARLASFASSLPSAFCVIRSRRGPCWRCGAITPRLFHFAYVCGCDLFERRVARTGEVAAVHRPVTGGNRRLHFAFGDALGAAC